MDVMSSVRKKLVFMSESDYKFTFQLCRSAPKLKASCGVIHLMNTRW